MLNLCEAKNILYFQYVLHERMIIHSHNDGSLCLRKCWNYLTYVELNVIDNLLLTYACSNEVASLERMLANNHNKVFE